MSGVTLNGSYSPDPNHPSTLQVRTTYRTDQFSQDNPHWMRRLHTVDPDRWERVRTCGSSGDLYVEFTPTGRRLRGGWCMDPFCAECGPRLADRESQLLSDSIFHLTAVEGVAPDRIVFGGITMTNTKNPDTQVRTEMLHAAMEAWTACWWFRDGVRGWVFAFDVSGTLGRQNSALHTHWHILLVLAPDADLEGFKDRTHDLFRKRLGKENVWWRSNPEQWDSWLKPAKLTPAEQSGQAGYVWKPSAEVGACLLKAGKRGEGYSSFYDRSEQDLKALLPLMNEFPLVTRGGILADTHDMLELRDLVHERAILQDRMILPDQLWVNLSSFARRDLLYLLRNAACGDDPLKALLRLSRTMPTKDWEVVLRDEVGKYLPAQNVSLEPAS